MAYELERPFDDIARIEIPVSGITNNIYVIGPPQEAMIVDAGTAAMAEGIIEALQSNGYSPGGVRAIHITHGHLDHYGGAATLKAWCGAAIQAHPAALCSIEDHRADYVLGPGAKGSPKDRENFRAMSGPDVRVERLLRDGDVLEHAGLTFDVHHMPGHQRGLIVLLERNRRLAFTGDLIQGGMDCSANWLGLFDDPAAQRRSLARLAELKPAWLLKGHRRPRTGDEVAADIAASRGRLDKIEASLLAALGRGAITQADAARAVVRDVLGMELEQVAVYVLTTVNAFLADLGDRGLAVRNPDLTWRSP